VIIPTENDKMDRGDMLMGVSRRWW